MFRERVLLRATFVVCATSALVWSASCGDDESTAAPAVATVADGASGDTTLEGASPIDAANADQQTEAGAPALVVSLDHVEADGGPLTILVRARATEAGGAALLGGVLSVTAAGATVAGIREIGGGDYEATVTPASGAPSGELALTVRLVTGTSTLERKKTAVLLPTIAPGWMMPESVEGLVNTPAYEDGVIVSPDGDWLFVSSYSPVDALCCLLGCKEPANPFSTTCQTALGPYGAPERPGMPGAARIVSPTRILNRCDKLCFAGADGGEIDFVALPPVGAFGFRRQADGSFAEPFFIGVDADGCQAPFGYSMTRPPTGTSTDVVFAAESTTATGLDLYWAPLTLGAPNILAQYQCVAGAATASNVKATRLPLNPLTNAQGNPQYGGGYMFFDDEYTTSPPKMLLAKVTGALPDASFGPSVDLPVGAASDDRRQPYLRGSTLYYADNLRVATSQLSGDPALAGSWSSRVIELAGESGSPRVGAVVALGQPTVAERPDGSQELYFVYGVNTATGIDMQAGRVRKR